MATLVINKESGNLGFFDIVADTESESNILAELMVPAGWFRVAISSVASNGRRSLRLAFVNKITDKVTTVFDVKAIKDEANQVINTLRHTEGAISSLAFTELLGRLSDVCVRLEKYTPEQMRKIVDRDILQIPQYVKAIEQKDAEIAKLNGALELKEYRLVSMEDIVNRQSGNLTRMEETIRKQTEIMAVMNKETARITFATGGNYIKCRLEANEPAAESCAKTIAKHFTEEEFQIVEKFMRDTLQIHYDGQGSVRISPDLYKTWGNCFSSPGTRVSELKSKLEEVTRQAERADKLAQERAAEIIKLRNEQAKVLVDFNKAFNEKVQEIAELEYHGPRREGKTIDTIHMEYWAMRCRAEDAEKKLSEEKKNTMISGKNIFEIHKDLEYHIAKYKALKDELSRLNNGL